MDPKQHIVEIVVRYTNMKESTLDRVEVLQDLLELRESIWDSTTKIPGDNVKDVPLH